MTDTDREVIKRILISVQAVKEISESNQRRLDRLQAEMTDIKRNTASMVTAMDTQNELTKKLIENTGKLEISA